MAAVASAPGRQYCSSCDRHDPRLCQRWRPLFCRRFWAELVCQLLLLLLSGCGLKQTATTSCRGLLTPQGGALRLRRRFDRACRLQLLGLEPSYWGCWGLLGSLQVRSGHLLLRLSRSCACPRAAPEPYSRLLDPCSVLLHGGPAAAAAARRARAAFERSFKF
jgi:hypothetical protein